MFLFYQGEFHAPGDAVCNNYTSVKLKRQRNVNMSEVNLQ
jgi:hypothetical protein